MGQALTLVSQEKEGYTEYLIVCLTCPVTVILGHVSSSQDSGCCFSSRPIFLKGQECPRSSSYSTPRACVRAEQVSACGPAGRKTPWRDRDLSNHWQEEMLVCNLICKLKLLAHFRLKFLWEKQRYPMTATKLECLAGGWGPPLPDSPEVQQGHSCPSLSHPRALTRPVAEAAWEGRGCLPAGRVSEIDPPTSKVVYGHCSATEKLGTDRNKFMEEKSVVEPTTWKLNIEASQREECFPCWGYFAAWAFNILGPSPTSAIY